MFKQQQKIADLQQDQESLQILASQRKDIKAALHSVKQSLPASASASSPPDHGATPTADSHYVLYTTAARQPLTSSSFFRYDTKTTIRILEEQLKSIDDQIRQICQDVERRIEMEK